MFVGSPHIYERRVCFPPLLAPMLMAPACPTLIFIFSACLLPYETDPLLPEIDSVHHPACIHPGIGFNVDALLLVSPPPTGFTCLGWQAVVQDLLDALKCQCYFLLSYRQVAQVFFKWIIFVCHIYIFQNITTLPD